MTTTRSASTRASGRPPADETRGWAPLVVLLAGIFLVVLDFFIVNVALPSLQTDLGATGTGLQWVVAGYALTFSGLQLTMARLGDRLGRRRMFTAGVTLFGLASAACGVAPTIETLVLARLVQGVGGAMMSPMVLALITDLYDGPRRVRAIGAYSTAMGLAAVSGQLIGGLLIKADLAGLGWRAIFLVNLPVVLVALPLACRLLPDSRAADPAPVDPAELLVTTAALTALVLPLLEGQRLGWPAWTWLSLAASVVLAYLLVRRGRHLVLAGRVPLLDPAVFATRAVRLGLAGQVLLFLGMASFFLVLALYLKVGRGLSALAAGLVFTVMAVAYLVGTAQATALVTRWGGRAVTGAALVFAVGHLTLLETVHQVGTGGRVFWLFPGLVLVGLGMGVCLTALVVTVMSNVEPARASAASGAQATAQQLGNSVGVAVVGSLYFARIGDGPAPAFTASLEVLVGTTALVALLGLLLPWRRSAHSGA